jgi:hypothetical protein
MFPSMQLCALLVFSKCLTFSSLSRRHRYRPVLPLHSAGTTDEKSEENSNIGDEGFKGMIDEDLDFFRNFQKAKASKFGDPISQEQLQLFVKRAEEDYLRAMKVTRDKFQQIKQELGSKGAAQLFLNKIQREDERSILDVDQDDDNHDDDDDDEGTFH